MKASAQERLVTAINRAWADLARPLNRRSLTHSEGMALIRKRVQDGGIVVTADILTFASILIPSELLNANMSPKELDLAISLVDTEEKLGLILQANQNEDQLETGLQLIDGISAKVRAHLAVKTKEFRSPRGGRPKVLASAEDERKVFEAIKKDTRPGKKQSRTFETVASQFDVKPRKIKQIYLKFLALERNT